MAMLLVRIEWEEWGKTQQGPPSKDPFEIGHIGEFRRLPTEKEFQRESDATALEIRRDYYALPSYRNTLFVFLCI